MRALARSLLVFLAAGAWGAGAPARGQSSVWYDPSPLLVNLRAEDRRALSSRASSGELAAIPFYDLDLELADDQRTFRMTEEVWFTNTTGEVLRELALRIFANAVGERPRISVVEASCVEASCRVRVHDRHAALTVVPAEPIGVGGRLRVRLRLEGELSHIDPSRTGMFVQAMESQRQLAAGSLHGEYGLLAESGGTASLGNFYAMVADRRDGRWVLQDESTLGDLGSGAISHFRARIRCAQGSRVAVSGQVVREQTVLGRPPRHEVEAVAGMARNFAIIVSRDLHVRERRVGDVVVRSWFKSADPTDGEAVLGHAAAALRIYERRFGPYPYTDLDVVQAPLVGGAGGVEFSGLVTVAQMFYGSGDGAGGLGGLLPGIGSGMRQAMLEFVVAHEVAHQWWHGLVGSDARLHPFVDESLAQYSSVLYMKDRYGADRAALEARRQVAANYHMMRLQGLPDGPVDRPVAAFGHPLAYAGLVYGKGAFVYRELQRVVGDRAFFRALRRYVRRHRFGVAPPRALVRMLARGPRRAQVEGVARRWLDEAHGDEDLGAADMGTLVSDWVAGGLGGMGGGLGGAGPLVEQLLRALGGGGSGLSPSAPGLPAVDPGALRDAAQQLRRLGGP